MLINSNFKLVGLKLTECNAVCIIKLLLFFLELPAISTNFTIEFNIGYCLPPQLKGWGKWFYGSPISIGNRIFFADRFVLTRASLQLFLLMRTTKW
jgi:hypothetical protein